MAMGQMEQFLASIRRLESGSYEGNYSVQGVTVTSGMYKGERAYGAYQIMPGNWKGWAKEAGLAGADISDPKAQDAVARYKFAQYYREFGDWDLAAVAWFAGPGRARKAKAQGLETLAGTKDDNGTSVPGYVAKIRQYMGGQMGSPTDSTEAMAQRYVEDPDANPLRDAAATEEPRELAGAQQVGVEMVKMLSGLLKSGRVDGEGAHKSMNRLFKMED